MKIRHNMSWLDRIIRVFLSLVFIYIGFFDKSLINEPLLSALVGVLGIFNLLVFMVGFCPMYTLAGISTARKS